MKKLIITTLVLLILMANFSITSEFYNSSIESESTAQTIDEDHYDIINTEMIEEHDSSRTRQAPALNNPAGFWMDSFDGTPKVDWARTNDINISFGNVKMAFLKEDNYTVAFWHFDEGSGITAHDVNPIYNNGTLGGDGLGTDLPTWINGWYGNALSFDGVDDYVDAGNNKSLNLLNKLTIEAWIYLEGWGENGNYGYGRLVDKNNFLIYPHRTEFVDYNDYSLVFTVEQSSTNYPSNTPTNSLTLDRWYYIAATYDGTTVKMYIDGNSQTLNQPSGAPSGNIDDHETDDLLIGETVLGDRAFDGFIDELRISNISRVQNTHYANITSKTINLPTNMYWDTLIINKTEPQNSAIEVKILNANNNQQIPGSPRYISDGEFDISYIDPVLYPSIKLNASFMGKDLAPLPILHYWGVSWNTSDNWQDTFFGGLKVENFDRVTVQDGGARVQSTGSMQSKAISIPDKHYYDTLILNKTEPTGGSFKVSVLDAQSNSEITGYKDMILSMVDLSGIDPHNYPAIKLKTTYTSTGQAGTIHDWSFNWTENTAPSVQDISSPTTVNRTKSVRIAINLTDHEDIEKDLLVQVEYKSPADSNWKTAYLSVPFYDPIQEHWLYYFTPQADAVLGNYSFRFTCNDSFLRSSVYPETYYIKVKNNAPVISGVSTQKSEVLRTKALKIDIKASDIERPEDELAMGMKYKGVDDTAWKSISKIEYSSGTWSVNFIPPRSATVGDNIINITCNDTIDEVFVHISIRVLNNIPTKPVISISPIKPTTVQELKTKIETAAEDVETYGLDMEYWYRWYKDNVLIPEFDNYTILPTYATTKGETWHTEVYPFDGNDLGPPAMAIVTIFNSPPEVKEKFSNYVMFEDTPVILENKLATVFNDVDNDTLIYTTSAQKNIVVEIYSENGTIKFTPDENWFGKEDITFYASDSVASAEQRVRINVKPTNDLPVIVQVGSQLITKEFQELDLIMDEDDTISVPIIVEDADGDVERGNIRYSMNITNKTNLYFDVYRLVFKPVNEDVGWHYFNISITDNNETPIEYISQRIRIQVLNVNDPPTVRIISPQNKDFKSNDKITFECRANDVDLLIPESQEKLTFSWSTNHTKYRNLGTGKKLTNISLSGGYYSVTVTVEDSRGKTAQGSINIHVKEAEKDEPRSDLTSSSSLIAILFIIIIIIILIIVFIIMIKKKKKLEKMGIQDGKVLHPVEAYQPSKPSLTQEAKFSTQQQMLGKPQKAPERLSGVPQMTAQTQTQAQPKPQPTPQLPYRTSTGTGTEAGGGQPQAQPQTRPTPTTTTTQPTSEKAPEFLSTEEKVRLLEDRLVKGEIDFKTFQSLKARFEGEESPYQPTPKLPPADRSS